MVRRILIVEDDTAIRETMAELLLQEGYDVTCAANGAEALEALEASEAPSVILLDLMMPRMDGEELGRVLRSHARLGRTRVVVVSAARGADTSAVRIGADAFLPKPFDVSHLLATVDRLC